MLLLVLSALALVGQALSAWAVRFNYRHTPSLADEPEDGPRPSLLAIVPARNERANVGPCLDSLRASRYGGPLAIRLVDDGSSDGTGAIARAIAASDPRVEAIEAGPLPDGWLGKSHACAVAAEGATSDWLLFADADLRVAPDCLARAVSLAERRGVDLLCLVPRMETIGFWERAAQALMAQLIDIWLPARDINDPTKKAAAGTGPFMLFRRSSYERIGGHEAVRSEVVEDLRLAESIKTSGMTLLLARGIDQASLRMYDSLKSIIHGWSKNMYIALRGALWAAPLLGLALLFFYGGPWILPIIALGISRNAVVITLAISTLVVAILGRIDLANKYGVSARGLYLAPLGAMVMSWVIMRSAWRAARNRPTEWKGRSIAGGR